MKPYIIGLLFLTAFCAPLFGQDNDDSRLKQVRFIAFNCNPNELFMTQSDLPPPPVPGMDPPTPDPDFKETQIQCMPGFRSGYYPYDPAKPVKLIRHVGIKMILVSTIDLTNACKLPLVLLTPAKDPNTFLFSVVSDDKEHFPGGSFNVFNFSSNPIKVAIGTANSTLQPNQSNVIIPEKMDQGLPLAVSLPEKNQAVYTTNWMVRKQIRYIFFVTDDSHKPGSVMFFKTSDCVDYLTEK